MTTNKLFDYNNNLGTKYEEFLYEQLKSRYENVRLIKDAELQTKGADIIATINGKEVVFDAKSSTKTAETGNLQFDLVETFDSGKTYRTGWLFNGTLTDWLVFYVPMGDKLIEYSVKKTDVLNLLAANYDINIAALRELKGRYTDVFKFYECTADGRGHKTLLWCPNVFALAAEVPVFRRIYKDGEVLQKGYIKM